ADVGRQHVDVVEALDRRAAPDVPLRLVLQRRAQVLGRVVALDVVVELEEVAVRAAKAVARAAAALGAVGGPLAAEPRRLHRGDAALERLRTPCPDAQ